MWNRVQEGVRERVLVPAPRDLEPPWIKTGELPRSTVGAVTQVCGQSCVPGAELSWVGTERLAAWVALPAAPKLSVACGHCCGQIGSERCCFECSCGGTAWESPYLCLPPKSGWHIHGAVN